MSGLGVPESEHKYVSIVTVDDGDGFQMDVTIETAHPIKPEFSRIVSEEMAFAIRDGRPIFEAPSREAGGEPTSERPI